MSDFALSVTAAAAIILGALYVTMTLRIALQRRSKRIVLGHNDDAIFERKIRGHGNAAEQIPLGLILLGLNEAMNGSTVALVLAILLIIGRFLHAIHFFSEGKPLAYRAYGMMLTLGSHILGMIALAIGLIV